MNILNSRHILYFLPTTRLVILLAALTTAEDVTNSTLNRTGMNTGSVPVVISHIDHIIVKEGSSALIDCNVQGSPSPHYKWYNSNGHLLQEEENKGKWWFLDNGLLNITSVSFEDRALQQTIASNFSQPMKTTRVYKDFIKSLGQTRRFSLCYTHLCHTRWGLFPYNHSCVGCTIARGVCILCLVIFIFFYCSSKPEVLKLRFVPAKSSC